MAEAERFASLFSYGRWNYIYFGSTGCQDYISFWRGGVEWAQWPSFINLFEGIASILWRYSATRRLRTGSDLNVHAAAENARIYVTKTVEENKIFFMKLFYVIVDMALNEGEMLRDLGWVFHEFCLNLCLLKIRPPFDFGEEEKWNSLLGRFFRI